MKRGFTLMELAVALALLGTLVLALAFLLRAALSGSQRAQAEAQLQADLQEIRARLTEDVLLSTGLTCTPAGANLSLPSGSVAYSFSGGQLLRNGVALTLQGGYGGSFSCDGRTLTLNLTWDGSPVATIAATRRVGLALANGLDEGDFPMDTTGATLQGQGRRIRGVRWTNGSGQTLYLHRVTILAPNGYTVDRIQMREVVRFLNDATDQTVPAIYSFSPPHSVSGNAVLELERLEFNFSIVNQVVRLEFRFCLVNTSPCPAGQEVGLTYSFVCSQAGCSAQ